jgi:hypothetical protein
MRSDVKPVLIYRYRSHADVWLVMHSAQGSINTGTQPNVRGITHLLEAWQKLSQSAIMQ